MRTSCSGRTTRYWRSSSPASGSGSGPLGRPGVVVDGLSRLSLAFGRHSLGLFGLGGNPHLCDFEDELVGINAGCEGHPLGERHLGEANTLVDLGQAGDVDVDRKSVV